MKDNSVPHKDPSSHSLIPYVITIAIAVWGGIANNIRKLRDGTINRFSIAELIGDITISGFIGVITFYLCVAAELSEPMTAALVGISAHMGTRGLALLEDAAWKRLESIIGGPVGDEKGD